MVRDHLRILTLVRAEYQWSVDRGWGADALEIEVGDDGRGADDRDTGHGIAGRQERAELYGGRVRTVSSPGAGSRGCSC